MIAIIDYGSGNLKSIQNGFKKVNEEVTIIKEPHQIQEAEALVLPGVGAFGLAMKNLDRFKEFIIDHILNEKPFLGICLGLQVLFNESEESPGVEGLNIFPGKIKYFPDFLREKNLKIPHMGWNNLQIIDGCPLLSGIGDNSYFYFVHSYYADPVDKKIIAAKADYGIEVPAVICQNKIFATQFHPERSGELGLQILKNFVELI